MPSTNRRPFVAIGAGLTSKRAAQKRATSMTRMAGGRQVYRATPKQSNGQYGVQRVS